MASKVLVPTAPFAKLQVKKPSPDSTTSGFIIAGGDAVARVAHLEHSVRFLQEQHRLMLSGLHAEIEALRERNRDLQFQLIFNKEATPKPNTPSSNIEEITESNEEASLRREVSRLEREAAAARGDARAGEARALQLQRLLDAQNEKVRELEVRCASMPGAALCGAGGGAGAGAGEAESRAELRARLADAERLVRRLRGDAERQRRELQCMKSSLHASLRAGGLDAFGYQNHYAFPPAHAHDFWREPLREEYSMGSRGRTNRRPLTLPELSAVGQPIQRSTVYANHHTRSRGYGYEKTKKTPTATNGEAVNGKSSEEPQESRLSPICTERSKTTDKSIKSPIYTYPELKIVVTKIIPHDKVAAGGSAEGGRARARRAPRKPAPDHT